MNNFDKVKAFSLANYGDGRIEQIDENHFKTWVISPDSQFTGIAIVFVKQTDFCPNGYAVYSEDSRNFNELNLLNSEAK
jgi:hypothetical protein